MFEPGWLKKQYEKASEDIKKWPEWMRREAAKINSEKIIEEETQVKSESKKAKKK